MLSQYLNIGIYCKLQQSHISKCTNAKDRHANISVPYEQTTAKVNYENITVSMNQLGFNNMYIILPFFIVAIKCGKLCQKVQNKSQKCGINAAT